jgi:hypothetical protein
MKKRRRFYMGYGYGTTYYFDSKNLRYSFGKIIDITHNKIVSVDKYLNNSRSRTEIKAELYFRALRKCLCQSL